MQILLTNDDSIFAPGLSAMYQELSKMGEVHIVAPIAEQSGVSQALTFREPLTVKDVFLGERRWGWGVQGTPSDCVKIGLNILCEEKPDFVVSGMNWGQNCGSNIYYSGTLGAAFDAALFNIPSFAVSVEFTESPRFTRAAEIARQLIAQIMEQIQKSSPRLDYCGNPIPHIYNINVSTLATTVSDPEIVIAPMDTTPYNTQLEARQDTFGRAYYWLVPHGRPRRPEEMTDMNAMQQGKVIVTPLIMDRTNYEQCQAMQDWNLNLPKENTSTEALDTPEPFSPNLRIQSM